MEAIAGFVIAAISHLHYLGVVLMMAIESACIPLPSEVTMPFAGFLAFKGELDLWWVSVAGAAGCVLGSWVAYAVGAWGGRPLVERYGKYLLLSKHDLDLADRWFARHGELTIFVARLLPVVRTFIAFPAGVARMPLWRFTLYTFLGSLPYCWFLAWIGLRLGQHWDTLGTWFHRFDTAIGIAILLLCAAYVWRHVRNVRA
ncbi:MAG TPA: DedA family protein [Rhodanobacter sp.]|nr:DedA family protein [Rhodanobacter sp.]